MAVKGFTDRMTPLSTFMIKKNSYETKLGNFKETLVAATERGTDSQDRYNNDIHTIRNILYRIYLRLVLVLKLV